MKYEIKIPSIGESLTEATIGQWLKKNGQFVKNHDLLLMIESDKASVEIVSENEGVLFIQAQEGTTLPIGSVIGWIDSEALATYIHKENFESTKSAELAQPTKLADSEEDSISKSNSNLTSYTKGTETSEKALLHPDLRNHLSPSVRRVLKDHPFPPEAIERTGREGRITKEDALNHLIAEKREVTNEGLDLKAQQRQNELEERKPMSTLRKRIAEKLVQAQQNAAILTTINEVDLSRVIEIRHRYKESFKDKHSVSLGFMSFFVKASVDALKTWPILNSTIEGSDIVYKKYYNIGVAVGTEKGLIVPILKQAQNLSFAQIEMSIRDYALKAREGKISIEDLSGGTFTISNGGVYGSLLSTPILNPPQSAILGLHKVQDRAVVIDGKIEIRPMMYLALSYDHRIIDGKEAVSFLVRIKEGIEDPDRLLLGL